MTNGRMVERRRQSLVLSGGPIYRHIANYLFSNINILERKRDTPSLSATSLH